MNYYIDDHGGVAGLRYYKNIDRKENYLVKSMLKDEIFEPSYPEKNSGLGICIDSLYGNRIELKAYQQTDHSYKYVLHFIFITFSVLIKMILKNIEAPFLICLDMVFFRNKKLVYSTTPESLWWRLQAICKKIHSFL